MAGGSLDELGELQRAVLEKVWEFGEATVQQVRDSLAPERSLAFTTVLTVMQKLEQAGWLTHHAEGRVYHYRATRTRNQAATDTVRQFMWRVFGGDSKALFQHLLDDENITEEELAEFRKMIVQRKKAARRG